MKLALFRLLAGAALLGPASAALAQDAPPTPSEAASAVPPEPAAGRQVYTPADFARFAPRNALDMLRQVPGFSIRESEVARGLGQATGNVLVNGQRLSAKSDTILTQLSRIPADTVTRIEIVDGATLELPGLSGQVANVIAQADAFSGQFSWKPEVRAHFTDPLLTRAEISASGRRGALQYELGLSNEEARRNGAGGPTRILDAGGAVTERRNEIFDIHDDLPKLTAKLTLDGPGSSVAHLNGQYQRTWKHYDEAGIRVAPGVVDRFRTVTERNDTRNRHIDGDVEFALGPGRLKLIGLDRSSREPFSQTIVTRFLDASPASGDRFAQTGDISERIARGEYSWKMLGGDWQASAEAAFNSLDNVAGLFTLDPAGAFIALPFPAGSGVVEEDRYDGSLSYSRPLGRTLSLQVIAAAEHSTLAQSGVNGLTRRFFRPKGTLSLAWQPSSDFDLSTKLRRRVGQLSFYDFLARTFLNDDNQNAGNNQLVPQQDWSIEVEANQRFGAWGSAKLRLIGREVEDYVDVIPVGAGESIGNVPRAHVRIAELIATLQFDPLGWTGAKLDLRALYQDAHLDDPFTGERRPYSGLVDQLLELDLRHDIPGSDWAWAAHADYAHVMPTFRRSSVDRIYEGPMFASVFVENKDVLGLTVRATLDGFTNPRSKRHRVVYTGVRGASPIAFVEKRDRLIGPIVAFQVKGTF